MPSHFLLALILMLTVFQPDETLRRYGGADHEWHLVTLDGRRLDATTTLMFPERNQITGQAPCNRYTATNTTPYPWIDIGPIAATRMACPDLADETAYFAALEAVNVVVIEDNLMTMSDEEGPRLVFKSRD
ncbi:META domain-containing protein [Sulfitobacter sp. F26204]|uniref:META domain-containing protein n=1 Tax=Sulfitobacter sp. F26204 TaxID=2996014 RepID=UPI00225DF890|nr:META domain-containing protein [Sulfitobacter sp. F26204]MCX7558657.1 META domain-containing protein [Sulfitobacter sp. F26204]